MIALERAEYVCQFCPDPIEPGDETSLTTGDKAHLECAVRMSVALARQLKSGDKQFFFLRKVGPAFRRRSP